MSPSTHPKSILNSLTEFYLLALVTHMDSHLEGSYTGVLNALHCVLGQSPHFRSNKRLDLQATVTTSGGYKNILHSNRFRFDVLLHTCPALFPNILTEYCCYRLPVQHGLRPLRICSKPHRLIRSQNRRYPTRTYPR